MMFRDIIRRKRDGHALRAEEIEAFVAGLADDSLPADQVAAMAMAIYLRSLGPVETGLLTKAMARSGTMLDWSDAQLDGPVVDKHSTGGVGDKVSLLLAPIVAACGGYVPMISGGGLDHTGGTLDKLTSIPGYDCLPGSTRFRRIVQDVGCAVIGQTDDLAPADRRLYAVRDVTATVESLPLICASILSKKTAAGIGGLVMDVKYGTGAFMPTSAAAEALADALIATGAEIGLPVAALITDMNQVLGRSAGNAIEVREAIAYLAGTDRESRLHAVTIELATEMLMIGGLAASTDAARDRAEQVLADGSALDRFARMVVALGGPADLVERPEVHLPLAPVRLDVVPPDAGRITGMDVRAIGVTLIGLGAGRARLDDVIDYGVGIGEVAGIGDEVGPDRPVCTVHARSREAAERAASSILKSCGFGERADPPALFHSRRAPNSGRALDRTAAVA